MYDHPIPPEIKPHHRVWDNRIMQRFGQSIRDKLLTFYIDSRVKTRRARINARQLEEQKAKFASLAEGMIN